MEVGKVYALSEAGVNRLRLVQRRHPVSESTRVTVVGGKRLCDCGSKIGHTDCCGSHYQWMETIDDTATEVLLSTGDIREV